jgi:hypothetical protein
MTFDKEDAIPDDSEIEEVVEGYNYRGHFLDLRTLAFALTDEGLSHRPEKRLRSSIERNERASSCGMFWNRCSKKSNR